MWSLWVDVGTDGHVERAGFPDPESSAAEPPECVLEALRDMRFDAGPPACGSVQILQFRVSARP